MLAPTTKLRSRVRILAQTQRALAAAEERLAKWFARRNEIHGDRDYVRSIVSDVRHWRKTMQSDLENLSELV